MGLDEDVELIVVILLVLGSLPFLMAWWERTLDQPVSHAGQRRHWFRRHRAE